MSRLTPARIALLAARKGAKHASVVNFLSSVDCSMPIEFHFANLERDAKSYRWNAATVAAIRIGLLDAYYE